MGYQIVMGIPESDGIPDKGPTPRWDTRQEPTPPTSPILPLLQSDQTPHTPWLGCLIRCSFQSHLVWVQSHFTCSPPCENNIFNFTWKNSQNDHETTPLPSIRYLHESPNMPQILNSPIITYFPVMAAIQDGQNDQVIRNSE